MRKLQQEINHLYDKDIDDWDYPEVKDRIVCKEMTKAEARAEMRKENPFRKDGFKKITGIVLTGKHNFKVSNRLPKEIFMWFNVLDNKQRKNIIKKLIDLLD